jgi:hypothetical protein
MDFICSCVISAAVGLLLDLLAAVVVNYLASRLTAATIC